MWATRNKCFMCKHKLEQPFVLPVDKPTQKAFQPNFNIDAIFHLSDTHGIPDDVSRKWIIASIYGLQINEFGAKGLEELYSEAKQ